MPSIVAQAGLGGAGLQLWYPDSWPVRSFQPRMRILYIHATLVPPPLDTRSDRFFLLSETLEGDVLQPVWFKNKEEVEAEFGPGSYPVYTSGRFRYHWFLAWKADGKSRSRLAQFWFYVHRGVRLHRQQAFDCVVAYSHMGAGVIAALVKLLTRGKLVIEEATTPRLIAVTDRPRPTLLDYLKRFYSDLCLHLSAGLADRFHLLYPTQLAGYPLLRNVKSSVFHEFVPVSTICRHDSVSDQSGESDQKYVLLVGSPWYLKGVDRLVEAFKRLAADFPEVKLKLVGWYMDAEREQLEALRGNSPQIELVRAIPNPVTLKIISRCLVLVHPSRCEGLPRAVIEGLAAGVPVVGSDVAGIPYLIRQGESGFVVPGDDNVELEKRLRQLLGDPELRRRLGANGYAFAHTQLTERVYLERFTEMIRETVQSRE
jgi:glycosyltransferase involved in cell wall biosynthesis